MKAGFGHVKSVTCYRRNEPKKNQQLNCILNYCKDNRLDNLKSHLRALVREVQALPAVLDSA